MRKTRPNYDPKDPRVRGADDPNMGIGEAFKLLCNLGTKVHTEEGDAVLLDVLPLKIGGYKVVCRLLQAKE